MSRNEKFQEPAGGTKENKLVMKSENKVYDLSKANVTVEDEIEARNMKLPSALPTHLPGNVFHFDQKQLTWTW